MKGKRGIKLYINVDGKWMKLKTFLKDIPSSFDKDSPEWKKAFKKIREHKSIIIYIDETNKI